MWVFLDPKRVFDTVDHRVLLTKLSKLNFSTQALNWFRSYLANTKQCVVLGGVKSPYLDCQAGVPQGSILGPILFSFYLNNFFDVCKGVSAQLYVDDKVIFTPVKNTTETGQILTTALAHVQDWLAYFKC